MTTPASWQQHQPHQSEPMTRLTACWYPGPVTSCHATLTPPVLLCSCHLFCRMTSSVSSGSYWQLNSSSMNSALIHCTYCVLAQRHSFFPFELFYKQTGPFTKVLTNTFHLFKANLCWVDFRPLLFPTVICIKVRGHVRWCFSLCICFLEVKCISFPQPERLRRFTAQVIRKRSR